MFFDWTYFVFIIPFALFAMLVSKKVSYTYSNYSKQYSQSGIKSQEAVRIMLDKNGLYYVKIERISGNLTDHYDPKNKIIRLSDYVYNSSSTAAIGVACQEVGHAIQHSIGYKPLKLRNSIIPLTYIGSNLSWPLILIGLMFQRNTTPTIAYTGIALFGFAVLFQILTLPTEFDASKRALNSMEKSKQFTQSGIYGAKQVLDAAALTYVAVLASSIAQILRLTFIVISNSKRKD